MNLVSQINLGLALSRPVAWALKHVLDRARESSLASRRRRALRAAQREMERLDARSLRDLGLHECEASSAAAEFVGLAETTRRGIAPRPAALR